MNVPVDVLLVRLSRLRGQLDLVESGYLALDDGQVDALAVSLDLASLRGLLDGVECAAEALAAEDAQLGGTRVCQ